MTRPAPRVHFVASGGGHLDLLRAVAQQLEEPHSAIWVTTPGRGADSLRQDGGDVRLVPPIDADTLGPASAIRSLGRSLRLAASERPRTVVTSGAGLAIPFCLAARASGARLAFLETMARVGDSSRAARALRPFASPTLVQWPENSASLPGSVVCRPVLLQDVATGPQAPGEGTYVSLGTHHGRFDRLLRMVDDAAERDVLPRPVLIQSGWTDGFRPRAEGVEVVDWLPAARVEAALRSSELVIAQAAAGVAASTLRAGRRPLLLPRRSREGEHVDDHQEQIARKLGELGLAVVLREEIRPDDVQRAEQPLVRPVEIDAGPTMASSIDHFIRSARCSP